MPEPDVNPSTVPCQGLRALGDGYVDCDLPAAWLVGKTPTCDQCVPTFLDEETATIVRPLVPSPDGLGGALIMGGVQWVPASEGEPPVTDTRFAVLLISGEEVDFTSDERKTIHFLRPHYPGAKKPVPADCHWLLLPPIPERP